MPYKPHWFSRINEITKSIAGLPEPFVDRGTVESLLGVGRRRALQIMAPCISRHVGTSGLVDREAFVAHLRRLAEGEDGDFEQQRRIKVASAIGGMAKDQTERPRLLVAAPVRIVNSQLRDLESEGVFVEPGRITVEFEEPKQGLQKLLALAMAIGNDVELFEEMAAVRQKPVMVKAMEAKAAV